MFKELKMRVMNWWYMRQMRRNPEQVMRMIQDILHPPQVDWDLPTNDKIILDRYVASFLATKEIDYEGMDVSEEHNPMLYRLTCALKGLTQQGISWAAYDWMLEQYPDLEKLSEELGELDDWG
jgi:hypothetical protein